MKPCLTHSPFSTACRIDAVEEKEEKEEGQERMEEEKGEEEIAPIAKIPLTATPIIEAIPALAHASARYSYRIPSLRYRIYRTMTLTH